MTDYKFRAECIADVEGLQRTLDKNRVPVQMEIEQIDPDLPDVEVYLKTSNVSISTMRYYMRLNRDSHVMVQTLAPADCYTGERDWDV